MKKFDIWFYIVVSFTVQKVFINPLNFARVQLLVTEYYRVNAPTNFWDVYNIEAEALGQKVDYDPEGIPDADRTRPLIST